MGWNIQGNVNGTVASDLNAHIVDTTDAHDASAISFDPTGLTVVQGSDVNVQLAIGRLDVAIANPGPPVGAAGGHLTGTFPDPLIASQVIDDSMIDPTAAFFQADGAFDSATRRHLGGASTHAFPGNAIFRRRTTASQNWARPRSIVPSPDTSIAAGRMAIAAGTIYWYPIEVEQPMTVDACQVKLEQVATAGTIRFGLYADDGAGQPTGAPLYDPGANIGGLTATGNKTQIFGTPYRFAAPGVYWIAFGVSSGLTGTPLVAMGVTVGGLINTLANNAGVVRSASQTPETGLPTSPTIDVATLTYQTPIIGYRIIGLG